MYRRFAHNWILKITSLVLAIGLWSHVREQVNPWEVASFRTRLTVNAPSGFVLQNEDDLPRTVTIMVRGPHLTLRQLKGGTPANPLATGDDAPLLTSSRVRATLDFSLPRRGQQKVPIKVETKIEDVEMVGAKPSEITVKLDTAARKTFSIAPRFELSKGLQAKDVRLGQDQVEVSGASQTLARVASVRAVAKSKTTTPGPMRLEQVALVAVDVEGEVVPNLDISPSTVKVSATLMERQEEKQVPIEVRMSGQVASGYETGTVEVAPARASLRGPRSVLEKLDVLTVTININGERRDTVRRLRVPVPTGVELLSPERVRVRVSINAIANATSPPADAHGQDEITPSHQPTTPPGLPKPAPHQ